MALRFPRFHLPQSRLLSSPCSLAAGASAWPSAQAPPLIDPARAKTAKTAKKERKPEKSRKIFIWASHIFFVLFFVVLPWASTSLITMSGGGGGTESMDTGEAGKNYGGCEVSQTNVVWFTHCSLF